MPKITFIDSSGSSRVVDAEAGSTVMEAAIRNDVPGIEAECGGACMCATCHVYVDPAFLDKLPPIGEEQEEMLGSTFAERKPNSRLSCQIEVRPEYDGLIVRMPERQN